MTDAFRSNDDEAVVCAEAESVNNTGVDIDISNDVNGLKKETSKNQQRRERKHERFLVKKEERKEKRKMKKTRIREQKLRTCEEKSISTIDESSQSRPLKRTRFSDDAFDLAISTQPRIVVDCGFESLQTSREISSLCQQLMLSYGANRRSAVPVELVLAGVGPLVSEEIKKIAGSENWRCVVEHRGICEIFPLDSLIYLSADSSSCLEVLEPNKAYVVGGLVDRNRHKGITAQRAAELGIRTARLPIKEHFELCGSAVLTVNQVVEIILRFLELGCWKSALETTVPSRKTKQTACQDKPPVLETSVEAADQVLTTNPLL